MPEETFAAAWEPLHVPLDQGSCAYRYRGLCPISGAELCLPRTSFAEGTAMELQPAIERLGLKEGKMFGLLIGRREGGGLGYLKAFSGLAGGRAEVPGWAPPLHLPSPTPLEVDTVRRLAEWKAVLIELDRRCREHPYHALFATWQAREKRLAERHRLAREQRALLREAGAADDLERESRRDSMERRDLRRAMRQELEAPAADLAGLRQRLLGGKRERAALSRALQAQMHTQMSESVSSLLGCELESLYPRGIPTGSGDCCAPKLLAWAARNQVRPLAMAEFWWGPDSATGRRSGEFYPACQERCQPLLGPLLAAALRAPVRTLYQDRRLLVVDKPGGLLSVPGRASWAQDSVLTRLRQERPEVLPVHRLDLETSGVLLFALDREAQAAVARQFQSRTVKKLYLARLEAAPSSLAGRIDAALGPDPNRPGCYRIDPAGKSAVTDYRMLDATLVELRPCTGRSHQLRVHMAEGLGTAISGDRLYGQGGCPLRLHAARLEISHPEHGGVLTLESAPPF